MRVTAHLLSVYNHVVPIVKVDYDVTIGITVGLLSARQQTDRKVGFAVGMTVN